MNIPRIYPIHDQAITIEWGNEIDLSINSEVIDLQKDLQDDRPVGLIECVPAYSSLTVYFNEKTTPNNIIEELNDRYARLKSRTGSSPTNETGPINQTAKNIITIPVCYDLSYGTDLVWLTEYLKLNIDDIIGLHTTLIYRVYMIGFIPGFAYMGTLPAQLLTPRKKIPSASVPAGSVALAGKQTGIYPAEVPGGWQIIGRTPLVMFDKRRDPASFLKAGDAVQFKAITKKEFELLS